MRHRPIVRSISTADPSGASAWNQFSDTSAPLAPAQPPPPWFPPEIALETLGHRVRQHLSSQGESETRIDGQQTNRLVFMDVDATLVDTFVPRFIVHKKTRQLLRYPDTGRLVVLGTGPRRDDRAELQAVRQRYPQIPWSDYQLDYREFGSYSSLMRSPEIPQQFSRLRHALATPGTRSFIVTARSADSAGVMVDDYLKHRDVDVDGVLTPNDKKTLAALGLADVPLTSGQRKAVAMAGAITAFTAGRAQDVEFYDDSDANLREAMRLLPGLFPSTKFRFYDVVHSGNGQYETRLVAQTNGSAQLTDGTGRPMGPSDIDRYRSEDIDFALDEFIQPALTPTGEPSSATGSTTTSPA